MNNNTISNYLQIFNKRIFFDIASNGCGNGCVYCFTKNPNLPQVLLSTSCVDGLCEEILKFSDCQNSIISFCPNTEPMKSDESRELVYYAISKLHNNVKYIQIATKESIPFEYLGKIDSLISIPSKIRISISVPYLDSAKIIEPYAATIEQRLANFYKIKQFSKLCSILYLRPFNRQMIQNKERYAQIINEYKPDDICVGAEFVPKVNSEQLCTFMYDNDLAPSIFTRTEVEDIFYFVEYLRKKTGRKIFFSSVCNIANSSNYGCVLNLNTYDKRYCLDCTINDTRD